jgi:hypothetical protein
MTPYELGDESLALLINVLDEAYQRASDNDFRSAFVYRHTRNISDLGKDVLALDAEHRTSAARIIVRPMIESLFRVVAAVKRPNFAKEKFVAELEEEAEHIRNWTEVDRTSDFKSSMSGTLQALADYATQLRREHNITSQNRWNVFDTAREAGLDWQYARDYFLYSKYVHCTISGIISQEYQVGRGHVLQTAIFVMLSAAGHAVQVMETATPQAHIDAAASLMGDAITLVREGAFRDEEA